MSAFQSLRFRLLLPILACSLFAAIVVAVASWWFGERRSLLEQRIRFETIEKTLSEWSFPLNERILNSLAELTRTEFICTNAKGSVWASTLPISSRDFAEGLAEGGGSLEHRGHFYEVKSTRRGGASAGAGVQTHSPDLIYVLFDAAELRKDRTRTASLPLLTGLSTIALLTSMTMWMASRLVKRLSLLQQRVGRIAEGHFSVVAGGDGEAEDASDKIPDEVGRLGNAVGRMAGQLDRLWRAVHRQQGEKLLHQIAGGMAHSLRNSLTGARMAIELHASECERADQAISVAIRQLASAEGYVQRLLLVAADQHGQKKPCDLVAVFDDLRASLSEIARHRRVAFSWSVDPVLAGGVIADGPSFSAAVTNLVLNAIDAGSWVSFAATRRSEKGLRVEVTDDGPGVDARVLPELFEPFVTSRAEGLGLGLPLVKRVAEQSGGSVAYDRRGEQSVFTFDVSLD